MSKKIKEIRNRLDLTQQEKTFLTKIFTIEEKVKELDTNYLSAIKLAETYKRGWEQAESRIGELEHSLFELNGKYATRIKELYETQQRVKKLEETRKKRNEEIIHFCNTMERMIDKITKEK